MFRNVPEQRAMIVNEGFNFVRIHDVTFIYELRSGGRGKGKGRNGIVIFLLIKLFC